MTIRLKRRSPGYYLTADGKYHIWRMDYKGHWFVGNPDIDDFPILDQAGYMTKWEAKIALEKHLAEN